MTLKIKRPGIDLMLSNNVILLILRLSRRSLSERDIKDADRIIERGVDWEKFIRLAGLHGLAPLIFSHIQSLRNIPHNVMDSLKTSYLHNVRNSAQMIEELGDIVNLLTDNYIEAVQLKGVTLAEEILGDTVLYPSADIDILVKRADTDKVIDIMKVLGYKIRQEINTSYLDRGGDLHFSQKGKRFVDFHISPERKKYFNIPDEFWWKDLRTLHLNNRTYNVLMIENYILFLCLHLFTHGYSKLKFLLAISEMLRAHEKDIDWDRVRNNAVRFNAYRPMLFSLTLASSLLDAPVPDYAVGWPEKEPCKVRWIYGSIQKNIFKEDASMPGIMLLLTILQYDALEVVRRLFKWLFPSLEDISFRYSIPLKSNRIYLYYFLNPLFLILIKRR